MATDLGILIESLRRPLAPPRVAFTRVKLQHTSTRLLEFRSHAFCAWEDRDEADWSPWVCWTDQPLPEQLRG